MTPRHLTSHDMTLRHIRHMARHDTKSHHITGHDTIMYYYHTSPGSQPHDITPRHSTSHHHHRHTTETQPTTTKTPSPDGMAEVQGWCTQITWFGHRTRWWPCAHSIYI